MKTILLIDDEKTWIEDLNFQLKKSNYNTIIADSGGEGINLAVKFSPDLILCDISLPDIDGFDVYEKLNENKTGNKIPFIFISGKAELPSINERIKSINCGYLTKPIRYKKLIEAVEKTFGGNFLAKENVVLISKDGFYKQNFNKSLSVLDYNLLYAEDIIELEKILNKEKIKSIVIDLSISENNCVAVIDLIKKKGLLKNIHLFILDEKFNSKLYNKFAAEGISDYLIKSYNFDELIRILKIHSQQSKLPQKTIAYNNAKILLIEDDSELMKNLEYQLMKAGIQTFFANSGTQAIELAKKIKPDIILCDIILPDCDGFNVHSGLKDLIESNQIPFIFQSGKGDLKTFRKALDINADGLLIKPYKFKELMSVINNFINIQKPEKKTTERIHNLKKTEETVLGPSAFSGNINGSNSKKEPDEFSKIMGGIPYTEMNDTFSNNTRVIKKKCDLDYELEYFLNNHNVHKDYEKFIYNDVVIIKLNIMRAVLKEAQNFYKYIFDLITKGHNKFVIDFNKVEFIDSTFIGVLVSALKRISFNKGELKIVCSKEVSTSSYVMFDGLKNIFEIYHDIKEVINDFQCEYVN